MDLKNQTQKRPIKFRGIPIDEDCEWNIITGSLLVDIFGNTIIYHPLNTNLGGFRAVPVNPETVGQFTGLTDKNGVEIYEGDIVSFKRGIGNWSGKFIITNHLVCWDESVARFSLGKEPESIKFRSHPRYEYEVLGNMYENPELLQLSFFSTYC